MQNVIDIVIEFRLRFRQVSIAVAQHVHGNDLILFAEERQHLGVFI